MKKNFIIFFIFTIFLLNLIGCSNNFTKEFDWNQLTRVDVEILKVKKNADEIIIAEEEKIITLRELFAKIEWEENIKAEMARKEDVKSTLFFTYDKNMPERLFEYFIWFNKGGTTATIIDREKNALGTLVNEDAQTLKNTLVNN
ncbi:hypothetical protein [Cytobacillus massiliigabonensis]|uniref:hypothetical protein n=1 Tax=Cytobacillus massiliigabonensis TaxID=1871011 RepID=UPI000C82F9C5|nr:hypothetical protein [Cytobacillus massiliigabonensis]